MNEKRPPTKQKETMLLNEEDLKRLTNVNASFSHSMLLPIIRQVENREVKSLIGVTLYSALDTAYNNDPATLTDKQAALMEYVQPIVADLTMWLYAGKGTMIIDDKGFTVVSTDDVKPASETKIENYKQSNMNSGFNAIDDLIEFLEEHVTDYPDWVSSEAAALARSFVVSSAKMMQEYVPIRASRRMYMLVLPVMRRVEEQEVTAAISKELYDEIIVQQQSGTMTPENKLLLPNLRRAISHLTWSKSLGELALTINENGVMLMNNTFSGTVKALTPAESDRINKIVADHLRNGVTSLGCVKDYLQAHAVEYPLYLASECYIDVAAGESDEFENDPESGIVMF